MKFFLSVICLILSISIIISKIFTGFLNLFGNWDPSLAFVMIGALVVSSPLFHLIKNKEKPVILMLYYQTVFQYGENKFIKDCKFIQFFAISLKSL